MEPPVSRSVVTPPPDNVQDPVLYRSVVWALSAALLIGILGVLVLAGMGREIPDAVQLLAGVAVGGLVGLLAPSPASK